MAKNKVNLDMPAVEAPAATKEPAKKTDKKGNAKKKSNRNIGKFFRDIFSELKKVDWAKFTSTKNNKGVLYQTGIVLIIVLVFIVLITAMDLGLSELLGLLIGAV